MTEEEIIELGLAELKRAENKHQVFPTDPVHQVGIMVEEAGEALQATLNYFYHGGSVEDIEKETIQTLAMCVRFLKNLECANDRN